MSHSLPRWALAALLPIPLQLALTGGGRTQPRPGAPTFDERVDVRVVEVDVVVTDRQGKRVRGLRLDDFVLEVDGKERPIDYFSEVQDGWVTSTTHQAAKPTAKRANPPSTQAGPQVPTVQPTNYLVFIDQQFLRVPRDLALVLERAEEQLVQMRPGDRMAVLAFDGRRLSLLSNWSGSRQALRQIFAQASQRLTRGNQIAAELTAEDQLADDQEEGMAIELDMLGGSGRPKKAWTPSTCNAIERLELALDRLVQGATAALRGMRPPNGGRRVALLLSGGWPSSAYDYFLGNVPFEGSSGTQVLEPHACPRGKGERVYEPLWQTANLLGYTLYTIDVPPPPAPPDSVSEEPVRLDEIRAAAGTPGRNAARLDGTRVAAGRGTLYRLAEETGGRAFIAGDRNRALQETVRDTGSYYSLGFTPKWRGDDREHHIDVKVRREGTKVRHRREYVDLSDDARVAYLTEGALLLGNLPDALPMAVQVGKPAKGYGSMVVPLRLLIPLDSVAFVPQKHGVSAELELRVAVVDERGNRNQLYAIPVELGGDQPPPPGAHAIYDTEVKLRPRPHDLVLTLYQPLTDVVHASRIHVEPSQ